MTDGQTDGHRMTAIAALMHSIARQKSRHGLSDTGSPGLSRKKSRKTVAMLLISGIFHTVFAAVAVAAAGCSNAAGDMVLLSCRYPTCRHRGASAARLISNICPTTRCRVA